MAMGLLMRIITINDLMIRGGPEHECISLGSDCVRKQVRRSAGGQSISLM